MSIIIQCNCQTVYLPNVLFNKENNKPISINICSNHPLNILRQLPKSIKKQISETSSDKGTFGKSIKTYKDVLEESEFTYELIYIPPKANSGRSKRKRNVKVIWFHLPYFKSVKISFAKTFLRLLSKTMSWSLKKGVLGSGGWKNHNIDF